jgi:hypothetical protein
MAVNRSPDPAGALLTRERNQTVGPSLITPGQTLAEFSAAYPDKESNGTSKAIVSTTPPPSPQGGTPEPTPTNAWERVSRTS